VRRDRAIASRIGVKGGASITAREARRLAIAAQGLARPRPTAGAPKHLRSALSSVNVLQLDAINVLERTQFVVPFSRIGGYDVAHLHAMTGPGGWLHEGWAHAASLVPVDQEPLFRWRQQLRAEYGDSPTYAPRWRAFREENAEYFAAILDEVTERGPLAASQLTDPRRQEGDWWERRSHGRRVLEFLFATGELAAWRTPNFERVYDLPERVVPAEVLARPTPSVEEAHRELLVLAARSSGVATVRDLAGYHMIKPRAAARRVDELVDAGRLLAVRVDGWRDPAYVVPSVRIATPTRMTATFLSPFDSLVWNRDRTRRLFGFDYRIEVYVPPPKREYGYYVLPMLLGDQLVGRVDLKADRKASTLRVQAAYIEADQRDVEVAAAAAAELDALRAWLRLDTVAVARRGDLAPALERAVTAAPRD
jgi:uncharacterized protein